LAILQTWTCAERICFFHQKDSDIETKTKQNSFSRRLAFGIL
jgi:hypothetical protein